MSLISISYSRINTYTMCPERYRRRYVLGEIVPPGVSLIRGTSVHKGAEHNHRQKIMSHIDLKKSEILEIVDAEFDNRKNKEGFMLTKDEQSRGAGIVLGEAKDTAISLGGLYSDKLAPLIQPAMAEEKIVITLPNEIEMTSILDLATVRDEILDIKTGKRKNQDDVDNDRQLTFQGLMFKAKTKREPAAVGFGVLVDNKEPDLQLLQSTRNIEDYQALINTINEAIKGIQAGIFPPANDGYWGCDPRYCGYALTCKYCNFKNR